MVHLKKIFYFFAIVIVSIIILSFNVNPAFAHRPHDVISQLELSPNFSQDRTIFIIVRNNLFKSDNGGESWRRIVKGLDNQFFTDLSSLAISPQNSNLLFLSSPTNGIYKSQDGGESWKKVNKGLDTLDIDVLTIAPSDPNLILAAGTEKGLYKTDNGGQEWNLVLESDSKITAIAVFPNDSKRIALGDREGNLYLSDNRGETWKQGATIKNSGSITSIAIGPSRGTDRTFFVGTERGGIFKTVDGSQSFASINQGIPDKNIRDIIVTSQENNKYAIWVSTWNEGAFQSQNEGKTWNQYNKGLTKDSQGDELKSPHFSDLRVSPAFSQDGTIFLGGFDGLFKSTNGGNLWQEIETLSPGTITALAISPNYQNDSTIALVTYVGSPYISNDRGQTWKSSNKGLEVPRFTQSFQEPDQDPRRFFDVAFSPNYGSDQQIFATPLWNNFLKSENGGKSSDIIPLPNPSGYLIRGMTIIPSPNFAKDRTIYLGTQYGVIYRSTDGGQSFTVVGEIDRSPTNEPISLVISPNFAADSILYASGFTGVYQSVDGGVNWQLTTEGTALTERYRIRLAISPNFSADGTLLAGTEKGLFITRDRGKSWQEIKSSSYGEDIFVEDVAISPNYQKDRTWIFSTKGKGLFKTVDGGKTFSKIGDNSIALTRMTRLPSGGIPIQFSPAYATDQTIYGFGSSGTEVYKSTDGGETWETIPVPTGDNNSVDLLTRIELFFYVYRSRILPVTLAIVLAIVSYFLLGILPLKKVLPLNKLTIKFLGSLVVFLISLIIFL